MARINKLEDITGGKAVAGAGADTFLKGINETVSNIKSLLKTAADLGFVKRPQDAPLAERLEARRSVVEVKAEGQKALPLPRSPGLVDYLDAFCKAGLGEMTVDAILKELGPKKLSEIAEVIRNVTKLGG